MAKSKIAALGVAMVLSIIGWAGMPLYIIAVVLLDWRSYLVFPLLSGLMAWWLIYFYGGKEKSLGDFIEEKVRGKRRRKILYFSFQKIKPLAIIFSALFIGPGLTPIIIKLCVSDTKKAHLIAIVANGVATAAWIWVYLGGKFIIANYCETIKLSLGA